MEVLLTSGYLYVVSPASTPSTHCIQYMAANKLPRSMIMTDLRSPLLYVGVLYGSHKTAWMGRVLTTRMSSQPNPPEVLVHNSKRRFHLSYLLVTLDLF